MDGASKKGPMLLLLSVYVIDCVPYNYEYINVDWQNCSLRKWLNTTFNLEAFAKSSEISRNGHTYEVNIEWVDNRTYYLDKAALGGAENKLFILDKKYIDESPYDEWFWGCEATEYALSQGVYSYENSECNWWIKDKGEDDQRNCMYVDDEGDVCRGGVVNCADYIGVRPAMWINIQALDRRDITIIAPGFRE